jgi:hypothetical protein
MSNRDESEERALPREFTLAPILVDSGPNVLPHLPIVGFLTLAYITTPKLELLDMFCDLL